MAMIACTAVPAHAAGSFECTVEDQSLKLTAASAYSHGLGAAFVDFKAEAEVLAADIPEDLRKLDLSQNLVHHWLEGGDLRLLFYREREGDRPHAYVEIVVKVAGEEADDPEYTGTYRLTVFSMDPPADKDGGKTINAEGKVTCSVE
jgi:hypothetical protein